MSEVFYRKVGRRYQPVLQWDEHLLNALPEGSYILTVSPGRQSLCSTVIPEAAPLLCALQLCADDVIQTISDASAGQPERTPLTAKEQCAWAAYKQIAGPDSIVRITYPSAAKIYATLRDKLIALAQSLKPVADLQGHEDAI